MIFFSLVREGWRQPSLPLSYTMKKKKQNIAYITEGVLRSKVKFKGKIPFVKFMNLCSYRPAGFQFSPKFSDGSWDGRTRLAYQLKDGSFSFPSGLIHRVREFLFKEGYRIKRRTSYDIKEIAKRRVRILKGIEFRKYQYEAAKMALYHYRGIVKLPTASGKTVVASLVINSIRQPTIVLTNDKNLLYQMSNVLKTHIGGDVGIIGDGRREFNDITIGSIPTLYQNFNQYKDFLTEKKVLIIDEVHHTVAKTWYKLAQKLPCVYRIGLSATPESGPNTIMLEACTGKIIYTKPPTELVEEGYLSKPDIVLVKTEKPKLLERYDYHKAYQLGIVENKYRNKRIAKLCKLLCKKKKYSPIIIQTKKLDHYKYLKQELDKLEIEHEYLSGKDPSSKRNDAIQRFKDGKLKILAVSRIFDEAVDIPNIRTLIIASGGKSKRQTIQRLGRGMRKHKQKTSILVIDFFDETHSYLKAHSVRRKNTYLKEGHSAEVLTYKQLRKKLGLY